jgi:RNA polymerase sigma factor (sigma-70 family)
LNPASPSIPTSSPPSVPDTSDPARWFANEVQPHEGLLRNYLKRNFPAVRDVDDVVQDSYLRIWKTKTESPIQSAKAFLFKVARHLAIDLVRRQRVSPLRTVRDLDALSVIEDKPTAADVLSLEEKTRLLADALAALPDRCRTIVVLHKLEGLSQKEVAQRLGLSLRTVEVQVARGVNRCEDYLREHGLQSFCGS